MSKEQRLCIAVLVCALLSLPLVAPAAQAVEYEVTITNLTARQTFTPILVVSHRPSVSLFVLGQPASHELEVLAEAGDLAPFKTLLSGTSGVSHIADSGGPLPAGQSVTVRIRADNGARRLSLAAMLVPTNDGFFAVQDVLVPPGHHPLTLYANAYDAGGEANDELCSSIPGPPTVCQGEGFNPSRQGDVGFVHVHRAIHGQGDLDAAEFDWRNPVAKITIRRAS